MPRSDDGANSGATMPPDLEHSSRSGSEDEDSWETESFLADIIEEATEGKFFTDGNYAVSSPDTTVRQ
jgi:hypothetical protein